MLPHFPLLSSSFVKKKKKGYSVNLLLKDNMNFNFSFQVTFFKINCTKIIFFKIFQSFSIRDQVLHKLLM